MAKVHKELIFNKGPGFILNHIKGQGCGCMSIGWKNLFNRNYKWIILIVCIIAGALVIYKSLSCFVPFIIAFILASLMEPFIKVLINKLHLKRKAAAAISILLLITLIVFLIYIILNTLIVEAKSLLTALPAYVSEFYANISSLQQKVIEVVSFIPGDIVNSFPDTFPQLTGSVSKLLDTFIKSTYLTAISLPQKLVFVLVTILSTFFLSSDRDNISVFIHNQLPQSWLYKINKFSTDMLSSVFKLARAYIMLFLITVAELWIGLSIVGIPYAFTLAFLIGIVDILPVLGTGAVLIPWSVYSFISGDAKIGVSMLIIYLVILIVRQILEPKIVGQQIGVYPLVTLMAMYSGLQIGGVLGMMMGPIVVLMIKSIMPGISKGLTFKEFLTIKSRQVDV